MKKTKKSSTLNEKNNNTGKCKIALIIRKIEMVLDKSQIQNKDTWMQIGRNK